MAQTMAGEALLACIVLLGSSVQWLTGMGFALVAVPALVLLLGPAEGVVLANCACGAISVVGLASGWRQVRPGAMVPLCVAAACTVPAGTWTTRQLPEPVLLLLMGGLVTIAVLLVMRGARAPALRGTKGAVAAGAVGGFMNSAAGVGGPPVSLYAVNAGWTVREFVPNAQFYGVVVNVFSVAANGVPELSAGRWGTVGAAMVTGGLIGRWLAGRMSEQRARAVVLGLALLGGVTTAGKGVWGL
ncbi:sulfite exporter TauE/SafE family protein [Streptomyces ferrugineus]|uniref:Probable membrane transporter protein n=1 Tax=Streptomyces ferrugineus TaxID=1413221 RepID=A0A7M2SMQ2_9ACTN|nr:sulfite exporter TauE/SafE family protein [Streptomyces ferrugineus]QOV36738.1 sulfite exporter TauE/SafE family protein [Streptomyces ferrugineus]